MNRDRCQAPCKKVNPDRRFRQSETGQFVVEYILLLMVVLAVGLIIMRAMVSRDPDGTGFLIGRWQTIVDSIGKDKTDDVAR